MKKIIIEDTNIEINLPTCWEDITLETYVKIGKIEEIKDTFQFEELYLLRIIEILCGVEEGHIDEMTIEQIQEISKDLEFLQKQNSWNTKQTIEIDGEVYVFPKDMNRLTMGEYISIKTLQERIGSSVDSVPYILAVILRKGKLVNDKWVQTKFDVEELEERKNLFLKQPITYLLGAVDFFLGGKKTYTSNTEDFTQKV